MKRIKKILRSNKAEAPIQTIILFFVLFVLISVVMEYMRGLLIVSSVKDSLDRAVISVATDNTYNAFNGFREANSKTDTPSSDDVYQHLVKELLMEKQSSGVYTSFFDDGREEFTISGIRVRIQNENEMSATNTTSFTTTAYIEIPMWFWNWEVRTHSDIEVESHFSPKFDID